MHAPTLCSVVTDVDQALPENKTVWCGFFIVSFSFMHYQQVLYFPKILYPQNKFLATPLITN